MKDVKVGQVCEISCGDSVIVTALYPTRQTLDLAYTNGTGVEAESGDAPKGFLDRPMAEIVDLGEGRIIWNNEA